VGHGRTVKVLIDGKDCQGKIYRKQSWSEGKGWIRGKIAPLQVDGQRLMGGGGRRGGGGSDYIVRSECSKKKEEGKNQRAPD